MEFRGINMCYRPRLTHRVINIKCPECRKRIDVRRSDTKDFVCFECRKEFSESEVIRT